MLRFAAKVLFCLPFYGIDRPNMAVVSVTVVSGIEVARVVRLSPEYVLIAQVKG